MPALELQHCCCLCSAPARSWEPALLSKLSRAPLSCWGISRGRVEPARGDGRDSSVPCCWSSPAKGDQHALRASLQPSTVAATAPQPSPGWLHRSRSPGQCTSAGFRSRARRRGPCSPFLGFGRQELGAPEPPVRAPLSCPGIFSASNASLGLLSSAMVQNKCTEQ